MEKGVTVMNKLQDYEAYALIEKEYINRCKRIAQENAEDKELVAGYNDFIKLVQKSESLDGLIKFIKTDGDFYDDSEGFAEFLIESLIQINK